MRTTFIDKLCEIAERDDRVWLLTGDLGFSVLERFYNRFPERYINIGVAEQNMTGIAAGLALSGKIVLTYSIANFPTLRCVEQIRNDVCYHNANVKIVAVGGGLVYGAQGVTHHGTEDLAIMRALPNMTVVAPGDPVEAALATRAIIERPGPCYLRLGRAGEPIVHQTSPDFQIGKALMVRKGSDITLIATGGMLYNTVQAAEQLAQQDVQARVLSMHTLKPLDIEAVLVATGETNAIMTIEEHSIIGGLGSAVAEVLAEAGSQNITFKRLGIPDAFCSQVGGQEYLRRVYGLDSGAICRAALELLHSYRR
jgi:transketolase